ncbi:DNA internalization-related competence protein ComEC/Rec2 [Levilactobacillus enshiensis]|uniref:DNA internalization-related competence protein ComEC/Rec2 n=1 Tax=Levilactobacillus enshiensis TaxID=2590213 RepID=UPI001179AEBF|nr:DNA internalization-related competence protein ComEC/Rec2 [Levilactobacillus enshiensis]
MTPNHFFFISLSIAAVSISAGGHLWGGLVLLVVLLVRTARLGNRVTLVVALVSLLIFSGHLWGSNQRLNRRQLPLLAPAQTTELAVRVQPDAIVIRGALYNVVATKVSNGERVLLRGRLTSGEQLHQLQRVHHAEIWQITGQQQRLLPATNFNQFDSAAYWRHRQVVTEIKVTSLARRTPAVSHWWQWFNDWWHARRSRLIRYCEELPGALKVYALGLLPGAKAAESMAELQGMQRLGLLHLFAISGLHVALLLTAAEWLLVHLRLQREHWEWLLLLSLPGYWILAGGSSGVLRACLMRGLQLAGKRCAFHLSTLDTWAVALVVGLWLNPGLLFELGGQLSYGLSLALILLRTETWWWRQAGLTLLGLPSLLTGVFQWHSLTLLANWVVVPLFPVAILPVTLLGTISNAWFPKISRGCAQVLSGVDSGLQWIAQLPGNVLFGRPLWWVAWLWVGGTWWLFSRPARARHHWLQLLAVSYVVMFGVIHYPLTGEVAYFDVGQGDSILIREPFNRHISLIDTGGRLTLPQPRWAVTPPVTYNAERTSINYLKSRGIDHVDDLYLTHHDADHIGDLPAFLKNMRVKRLLVPTGMAEEPGWTQLLANSATPVQVQPIQVGSLVGLRVLHPFEMKPADNAGSLALQGTFGHLNFTFMGDLDRAGEQKILMASPQLRTDVLKLGHHGSKTATAPAFISQLQPRLAIISAGRQNRYGHPNPETLAILQQAAVPTVSTQTSGMIRYVYTSGRPGIWQTKLISKGHTRDN